MSTVSTQMPAPPGYYTTAGASVATKCPKRKYNPYTAQASCSWCKEGFYCDEEGMIDNIKDCPPGYYCPEGSETPTKCDTGTFMSEYNAKSAADCKPCLPGKYCSGQGLIEPTGNCDLGYFCTKGASQSNPAVLDTVSGRFGPCPSGFYCPAASPYAIPCPQGTYSTALLQGTSATCAKCDAGKYCSATALTAPEGYCDPGFYCPLGQVTARPVLTFCAAGQYCPTGSILATNCPAGTY